MKRLLMIFFVLLALFSVSAQEQKEKQERKAAEKQKSKVEDDKYDEILDLRYRPESYCELSGKLIRLEFFGKTGTFNLYCIDKSKNAIPMLSTADLFTSSGFLLRFGDDIQDAMNSNRVKKELRSFSDGVQLVYRFDNHVRLVIDFSLLSSSADEAEDIVKVRLYAINESRKTYPVDIRGIFDTVCGEVSSVHFTTDTGSRIRNETRFNTEMMQKERTIVSSNGFVSFQFVLDGIEVSPVEYVTLGNVDELRRRDWDTGFRKGRGFTSFNGYDNSAIMIDWPDFSLAQGEKKEFVFYIAVAADEKYPRGLAYVDSLPYQKGGEDASAPEEPKEEVKSSDKRTDVDFVVPPIKDYQLNPDYIQQLIDKIDSLQSSKNVNKTELRRLNAELDAILEKLRRQ